MGRSWLVGATGILLLLGRLEGAGGMEPETCSPLGDFPPPALLPNISSAQEGNLVLARCLVFSHLPVTHIFFCKNGVVLENHPVGPTQFAATLTIQLSAESSGTYCCGYRRRSNIGHIKISSLSIPWLLTTRGRKGELRNSSSTTTPELPAEGLGISLSLALMVVFLLVLALSIHLFLQAATQVWANRRHSHIHCHILLAGKRVQLASLKHCIHPPVEEPSVSQRKSPPGSLASG
ncbi:uncharacterized protein LOC104916161 isoform X2 [Meleagris gallopavo]|uniref:uncharacterized protein LOC104916161 isoform X2 n=1 Tax=Meleagris gallopavo TaxID=9103 RepID=UPI00093A8301|nr:uncharacterized protein LOC104916161 isoform X2 [Meleagris gallopavo]